MNFRDGRCVEEFCVSAKLTARGACLSRRRGPERQEGFPAERRAVMRGDKRASYARERAREGGCELPAGGCSTILTGRVGRVALCTRVFWCDAGSWGTAGCFNLARCLSVPGQFACSFEWIWRRVRWKGYSYRMKKKTNVLVKSMISGTPKKRRGGYPGGMRNLFWAKRIRPMGSYKALKDILPLRVMKK